jgi:hypothetical protein
MAMAMASPVSIVVDVANIKKIKIRIDHITQTSIKYIDDLDIVTLKKNGLTWTLNHLSTIFDNANTKFIALIIERERVVSPIIIASTRQNITNAIYKSNQRMIGTITKAAERLKKLYATY